MGPIDVSEQLIHRDVTVVGSWVTSTVRMRELLDNLADSGTAGKVALIP